MKIAFYFRDEEAPLWIQALRLALPQAQIEDWSVLDAVPAAARQAGDADYALAWAPPQAFIDSQKRIKALFNIGAGVDALLKLHLPSHVPVIRLDDAGMCAQMADYVCHYLLRHVREFDHYEAAQSASQWKQRAARARIDFPVGVMGLGVLGSHVAQAVRQFGFPVLGWSRSPRTAQGVRCFHGAGQLKDFLGATKVLVCLLPLTAQTRDMLNFESLSNLQPGAYLINVARGALLVEEDLIRVIDQGHLAGATLDVFRTEPLPAAHPFWQHPAIRVTPHISAQTLPKDSIAQIANKIMALERGEAVAGVVDLQRGY